MTVAQAFIVIFLGLTSVAAAGVAAMEVQDARRYRSGLARSLVIAGWNALTSAVSAGVALYVATL